MTNVEVQVFNFEQISDQTCNILIWYPYHDRVEKDCFTDRCYKAIKRMIKRYKKEGTTIEYSVNQRNILTGRHIGIYNVITIDHERDIKNVVRRHMDYVFYLEPTIDELKKIHLRPTIDELNKLKKEFDSCIQERREQLCDTYCNNRRNYAIIQYNFNHHVIPTIDYRNNKVYYIDSYDLDVLRRE
jgi:hypothetical protein